MTFLPQTSTTVQALPSQWHLDDRPTCTDGLGRRWLTHHVRLPDARGIENTEGVLVVIA
jgi:hypothetical protein